MDRSEPEPTGRRAQSRRRHPRWLIPVVAVVLVSFVLLGYWWLGHARVLKGFGDETGGSIRVGHTLYADTGLADSSGGAVTIDITGLHPRTTLNTADAVVELLTCTIPPHSTRIGAVSEADFDAYCPSAPAWRSGAVTIGWDPGDSYIVLAVTPRRAGQVIIDGVDVSFRDGIRRGTQHVGIKTVVTVQ